MPSARLINAWSGLGGASVRHEQRTAVCRGAARRLQLPALRLAVEPLAERDSRADFDALPVAEIHEIGELQEPVLLLGPGPAFQLARLRIEPSPTRQRSFGRAIFIAGALPAA